MKYLLCILLGCASIQASDIILEWEPVTKDIEGNVETVAGYIIRAWRTEFADSIAINTTQDTVFTWRTEFPGDTLYFNVSCFDLAGNLGAPSDVVFWYFAIEDTIPPERIKLIIIRSQ